MSEDSSPDTSAEEFEALRPRLLGVAYRMTGSVGDAEDVCQEAWLRWERGRPRPTSPHRRRTWCAWSRTSPSTGSGRRNTGGSSTWSVPPRAARQRRPQRSGGGGRALRLAHAGVPRDAGRAHADRARRSAAPRRVRLRVRRGRGRGRPFAGRVPAIGEPHAQEARPRARRTPAARRRARAAHGRAAPREHRERRHRRPHAAPRTRRRAARRRRPRPSRGAPPGRGTRSAWRASSPISASGWWASAPTCVWRT